MARLGGPGWLGLSPPHAALLGSAHKPARPTGLPDQSLRQWLVVAPARGEAVDAVRVVALEGARSGG